MKKHIIEICGHTIDFKKIESVGNIWGDACWRRYSVYFTGGNELEIFEDRQYSGNIKLVQMEREKFVKLWKGEKR